MPNAADRRFAAAAVRSLPRALVVVGCALAVFMGVALRVEGLGRKAFWYDEVDTALRISGRTEADVTALADGREIRAADLVREFQGVRGRSATLGDVLQSTRMDQPQAGAVYFPLARQWALVFGDGPAALRGLSMLASLVSLGLLAALAKTLFADPITVLLTVGFAAVSPFHLRYAHEARGYALWAAAIPLVTLVFVRAVRGGRAGAWLAYAVSSGVMLLLQPLSLFVLGAHAAAVLADGAARSTAARRFAWAMLGAFVCWLPWLVAVAMRGETAARTLARNFAWTFEDPAPLERLHGWSWIVTGLFFRTGGEGGLLAADGGGGSATWLRVVATLGLFGLVAAALAGLVGRARGLAPRGVRWPVAPDRFAAWLVLALALLPFTGLALLDLSFGGRRASVDRYLLPSWLGLELAVAWFLTSARGAWRGWVAVALLTLGVATGMRSRATAVWWNTNPAGLRDLDGVVARLETDRDAVLVTDLDPLHLLQLARRLDASRRLRIGVSGAQALPTEAWTTAWLVAPSGELREAATAASGGRIERVRAGVDIDLWRVVGAEARP